MKMKEVWKVARQIAKCASSNHLCIAEECWCPCHSKDGGKRIEIEAS